MRFTARSHEIAGALVSAGFALYIMLATLLPLRVIAADHIGPTFALSLLALLSIYTLARRLPKLDLALAIAISFFVFSYINLIFFQNWQDDVFDWSGVGALERALKVLNYSLSCFIAGISFPKAFLSRSSGLIIISAGALIIVAYLSISAFVTISWCDLVMEEEYCASHLSVEDGLTLLLFASNSLVKSRLRWLLAFALLYCLFLTGGRSTLVFAALALAAAEVWPVVKARAFVNLPVLLVLVVIVSPIVLTGIDYGTSILFPEGISADKSANERSDQFWRGLGDLEKQILGGPQYIYMNFGTHGAYIHNILSAWQIYGVIPFLIVSYLIIAAVWGSFKFSSPAPERKFVLQCSLYVLFAVLVAKYVGTYMIWFSLGSYIGTRYLSSSDASRREVSFNRRLRNGD
ncbi:MAG: hypothetical protein IT542_06830 [Rubellimicrobium sp.]|nr:hypothetical protein [Rubellimicrobium sp.]